MRSVTLTVVSIVLFAFVSNTVSALPAPPPPLPNGKMNADAAAAVGRAHSLGGVGNSGVGDGGVSSIGKTNTHNSISDIMKDVPFAGPLLADSLKNLPKGKDGGQL